MSVYSSSIISLTLLNFHFIYATLSWVVYVLTSFLKIIILYYFSVNSHIYVFGVILGSYCVSSGVMFLCFFMSLMVYVDVCAFEGTVTSSNLFKLAAVGKDFNLMVAERHWLVPVRHLRALTSGRAQWHGFCTSPSPEVNVGEIFLWRPWRWRWWLWFLGSSEAKIAWILLFIYLFILVYG